MSNANYLICIFMNFNENIKNVLKSINKHFSGPNHHNDTIIALVIYHVTDILMSWTYLKFFYLICIFMNTNYNVENRGKNQGKSIAIERFLVDYKIFLSSRTNFHGCQFGQRDHLNALKYCP